VWWGASPVLTVNLQEPVLDLTPAEAHIYSVNIMDQHSRFIKISDFKAQLSVGDTLWAGNREGFVLADQMPADSGYYVNNKFRWAGQHPKTGLPLDLKVPDDQNSFSFDFINTSIRGRDKILYSYLLDGVDTAWSRPNGRPFSKIYYNLEPGTYTFKVASVGFNSQWSAPDSFSFTIRPPWNQTWWAYLLFVSIFGGLTYGIVYLRSKYLQKENRILEDKVLHRTAQLNKSIDELKATQSQLIQSEKMASLGELTAGIAHEIQNPLNFVNNFSELSVELAEELKEELAKIDIDPLQKESLDAIAEDLVQNQQKIHHHGKRADAIVKGMLQHSRTGSGQKEPTDIGALADEYLRLSYHGIRAKDKSFNADFRLELDPDLPKVNVVAQDFGRVLLNLINNAFYACTERSRVDGAERSQSAVNGNGKLHDGGLQDGEEPFKPLVVVSAQVKGNSVEISVTDNGSGIPDSVKDKIFQPFFTTKPTGQGTGLGLSLSYDIVKAHGGELKVKTTEGGGLYGGQAGSTFIIQLPY